MPWACRREEIEQGAVATITLEPQESIKAHLSVLGRRFLRSTSSHDEEKCDFENDSALFFTLNGKIVIICIYFMI